MILAACVDEAMGLQFAGRRQSRDRIQMQTLQQMAGGRLRMSPASAKLAPDDGVYIGEDYLSGAADGDWCFAENLEYLDFSDSIQQIVLFQWNRSYPGDLFFQFPGKWVLDHRTDLAGSSHEKITIEVYHR